MSPAFQVTQEPLDPMAIADAVATAGDGAVATFVGLVRDHNAGRRVEWLDYEAYAPLAVKAFEQIAREAADRWPAARVAIHHRTGRLQIGEASVAIVAASPHRSEAFAVCRYAIERVKQIAPIWKREHFAGGAVWIEGATADPTDEAARAVAMERACT
ncbi:MAG TPA: molybdenum cofactor biosynthesis protein MoaE [Vicinamibacterales bacterium]|jgi:molybdopterin synthase catalytic subunit